MPDSRYAGEVTDPQQSADWLAVVRRYPELAAVLGECSKRLGVGHHGDAARWLGALATLPELEPRDYALGDTVRVGVRDDLRDGQSVQLADALRALHPWRKGPFELFGTHIASEWRSDWKWARIRAALGEFDGFRVLDIGAGNGYFGWRMLEAGAAFVLGIDPAIVFNMQHRAVSKYLSSIAARNILLPLRFEEFPVGPRFDAVFSMGVIYHRRDPCAHLARIHAQLEPGGRAIIETLVVGPAHAPGLQPDGRYARMRNVSIVPTIELLQVWLIEAGFDAPEVIHIARTTTDEQRSTDWMRFESLADALDPDDPERTVEGHPAPVRAVLIASRRPA